MQRTLLLASLLLAAIVVGFAVFFRGLGAPPPPPPPSGQVQEQPANAAEVATGTAAGAEPIASSREAVVPGVGVLLDDPEIRAALCGFKGRVVDAKKQPVADCGVRVYRGGFDSVLPANLDFMADSLDFEPQYLAGEVKTKADGTWLLTGVWPRAFYLLFAGLGTDAPTHQIVTRTPSPGEIVDLGDIVLNDAGVITGTVVDENGDGLAGALVRAADLPGSLAAFFPVERFDPEGAVLIREPSSPVKVLAMPKWVKRAFEHLPIPRATTDGEGRFRIVGVVPGSNMVATTKADFLSDVKPSVQVRPGQTKDVGRIKLKRGEELAGKVVDGAGKPIAGAEVVAGSTLTMVPFDLGRHLQATDGDGRFQGQGFAPGKVTVAARRDPTHAWTLASPQPVFGEVVVELPSSYSALVAVRLADGSPVKTPRFKLLLGEVGDGAAEMNLLGFSPPIDLRGRLELVADGQWRIGNLNAGSYTVLADAEGMALAFATFKIQDGDASVALTLESAPSFAVRVVDTDQKPIRNVAIYAESNGARSIDMPVMVGRTGTDGRFEITKLRGETLRVSAEHPKWGVVHGEAKRNEELVLVMMAPGRLTVTLTENGKPPSPGRFTIALVPRRSGGPRGAIEDVPRVLTPGPDGVVTVAALQPTSYHVTAIKSLDALHSPGGVIAFVQDAYFMRDAPSANVEVVSAQTAEVALEVAEKPLEGPTARLLGSLTIDGRIEAGLVIIAWLDGRRFSAKIDASGRFDCGVVPAKKGSVAVIDRDEGGLFVGSGSRMWSQAVELKEGEVKELAIEILTSSIAGSCVLPDGSPAAGVHVAANRVDKNRDGQWFNRVSHGAMTDADGRFRFTRVTAGTWELRAEVHGDSSARGTLEGVVVEAGAPADALRIEMQSLAVVKGRVDMSRFGSKQPTSIWIAFYEVSDKDGPNDIGRWADGTDVDRSDGSFQTSDLLPGRYRPIVHARFDEQHGEYRCEVITVTAQGRGDLLVSPGEPTVRRQQR